jgi:DNA-binding MarR family transcriptional regulator
LVDAGAGAPSCPVCKDEINMAHVGRRPRYCSAACRQRAYLLRKNGPVPRADREDPPSAPQPVERAVPHLTSPELLAWRGLLELHAKMLPALDNELRTRTNLTVSEFDVLYQLWRMPEGRCRMVDLSRAVLVTPGGVTRIVDRLKRAGLVGRTKTAGRQAVTAELTAKGSAELQRAMDVHFAGVKRLFLQYLSEANIDGMNDVWRRIAQSDQ